MKKIITALSALLILCSATFNSDGAKIPAVDVKKLDGSKINTSTFTNNGKPIIISFWATWCKPCKKELDAISEVYSDWQKETGVKVIAISTDDARSIAKVPNDVKTKGWEFEVYTDENADFQRAMNVVNVPHTFIINGKGEIVWSHNSYAEGDEDKLIENVKKVAAGQKLEH
jgi:cytochrome c biogenesis protein CcmG, thiol:disulfide interchange protein DsbE